VKLRRIKEHYRVRPGYWFAPKMFGLGATPVTWQGWLATLIFVAILFGAVLLMPRDVLKLAIAVPLVLAFMLLVWRKTDRGWHWRWGPDEK
jgi:hypothetical protein